MRTTSMYIVTTEGDCEGRSYRTLGYATGKQEDIKAYYDHEKMYEIRLEKTSVLHITPDAIGERERLVQEYDRMQKEKESLEKRLEKIGHRLRN